MLVVDYQSDLNIQLDIAKLKKNLDTLKLNQLSRLETFSREDRDTRFQIGLRLVDLESSQGYNLQYSGNDYPTDVLSFAYQEEIGDITSTELTNSNIIYLGDIVVCGPILEYQAQEFGLGLEAELHLLMIHGILHLLGYDHQDSQSRDTMSNIQDQYMRLWGMDTRVFFNQQEEK
ncbi:rRNA maturation RNase YbeY [Candidatus Saccharibacteria bacterium]|nr:rRNA maturation RNase YbeY [Candidatus Saccharibacteria bacterium]